MKNPRAPSVAPSAFVGRRSPLAVLVAALERVAEHGPELVLIGGDAGIGKTRLIQELSSVARGRGAVVTVGECVGAGAGPLPFAALATALRSLRSLPPEEVAAAFSGHENELAVLLPELNSGLSPSRASGPALCLFESFLSTLERLADGRSLVLILEDLHWGDETTLGLLDYVCRSQRTGRILIVATYRPDSLPSPSLLPFVAELSRLPLVTHMVLGGLTRDEVREQVAGNLTAIPSPFMVEEIHRRSEGNPFFVEELARAHRAGSEGTLTDSLRDLLLARLRALPEAARRTAELVAEGGTDVSYVLLRTLTELSEQQLIAALRAAVEGHVLTPTPDREGYRFRHALVREAVSDSVLPGERAKLNHRYAQALAADPSPVPPHERSVRLAEHWWAAGDLVAAREASLEAAAWAGRRAAWAERLRMLERVLNVWDLVAQEYRVPPSSPLIQDFRLLKDRTAVQPATVALPLSRLDVLVEAAVAARLSANRERALTLTDDALAAVGQDRPTAAWLWMLRSLLVQDLTQGDGRRELDRARDLVRGLPASSVHAEVLAGVAAWGARHQPGPDTLATAERAVLYAQKVGAHDIALDARLTRGWLKAGTDAYESGLAELYELLQRPDVTGSVTLLGRVSLNLPSALEGAGRSAEAVGAAETVGRLCREHGLSNIEAWVRCNQSLSLYSLGRWAESERALDAAAELARSRKAYGLIAVRRSQMALARGDLGTAWQQVTLARELFGTHDPQPQLLVHPAEVAMGVAAFEGRIGDARTELERITALGLSPGTERYVLPMLCTAAAIEADAREFHGAGSESSDVLAAIRSRAAGMGRTAPVWRAYRLLLDSELARASGAAGPATWARAAAAFEGLDRPYELARARGRWAGALLSEGQERAGLRLFRQAYAGAEALGARLLTADLSAHATRYGISPAPGPASALRRLVPPAQAGAAPRGPAALGTMGLTARETEVLRLVARGRSNRQIGEALRISPRTVGIHVSSILAKTNSASRTEAAALAFRLALFPDL
ncbi:helix-turn-helix transcriptional regulator [Streptomyces rubiginosohelvolus]